MKTFWFNTQKVLETSRRQTCLVCLTRSTLPPRNPKVGLSRKNAWLTGKNDCHVGKHDCHVGKHVCHRLACFVCLTLSNFPPLTSRYPMLFCNLCATGTPVMSLCIFKSCRNLLHLDKSGISSQWNAPLILYRVLFPEWEKQGTRE